MNSTLVRPTPRPTAADFSHEELLDCWFQTLDPAGVGPAEAVADDIASFTGESADAVRHRMAAGVQEFRRLWDESRVDASDPASVTAFYRDQFAEAYELAEWHCGRVHGTPPLGYARAALFARSRGLRCALDFGSGIGSGSLCLARGAGCEVHSADVARSLLDLVEHRMRRRGYQPHIIDLETAAPAEGAYDIITCFDVLEHVPDQFATLRRLESYLRVGGYLFINLMTDSSDEDRPMHISSAGNWLRMVRRTSLTPSWASFTDAAQVFVRRRGGRLRNFTASWIDRMQGM